MASWCTLSNGVSCRKEDTKQRDVRKDRFTISTIIRQRNIHEYRRAHARTYTNTRNIHEYIAHARKRKKNRTNLQKPVVRIFTNGLPNATLSPGRLPSGGLSRVLSIRCAKKLGPSMTQFLSFVNTSRSTQKGPGQKGPGRPIPARSATYRAVTNCAHTL